MAVANYTKHKQLTRQKSRQIPKGIKRGKLTRATDTVEFGITLYWLHEIVFVICDENKMETVL